MVWETKAFPGNPLTGVHNEEFSPNGACYRQPRPSAWVRRAVPMSPEGAVQFPADEGFIELPLQGLGRSHPSTQGVALGWNEPPLWGSGLEACLPSGTRPEPRPERFDRVSNCANDADGVNIPSSKGERHNG
jgi:hypothetical protein